MNTKRLLFFRSKLLWSFLLLGFCLPLFGDSSATQPLFISYCDSLKKHADAAEFDEAEKFIQLLDSLAAIENTPLQQADLLYFKGYLSTLKSGDAKSYDLLTQAAKIYTAQGLTAKQNLTEALLCANLYLLHRGDKALIEAERLLEKIPPEEKEARGVVHNIAAAIYAGHDGVPEKAIYHCNQAIPYFKEVENSRRLISLYGILTACANHLEDLPKALIYIDSSAFFATKANNLQQLAFLNIRKGRTLLELERTKEALVVLHRAEAYFAKDGNEHGQLDWVYSVFRKYYVDNKDFENAYKYSLRLDSLSNLSRIQENDKALNQLMIQYETEKKEQQIQLQRLTIANEQQRNQQLLLTSIGGLSLLVLLFALAYFYYRNQQQERWNALQFQYQEQLLETTINTQEAERKRIARDLHDGIGQQLTGLKMGFQAMERKVIAQIPEQQLPMKKLHQIITEAATDIRSLSHQMMPKALEELGLVPALEDMLHKSLGSSGLEYQFEHFGIAERLPENIEIGFYRIAQELVNNILKHAQAKEVTVQLIKNKQQLVFIIEDDGLGLDLKKENQEGHGFTNIRSRLQAIKGEIHLDSEPGQGTTATIRVPIKS